MTELKPCPFCGAEAKPMGEIVRTPNCGEWKHWYNGCVLSGFVIRANKIEAWNRRADNGRWVHEETEGGFHIWRCSRCGRGMSDNPEGIDLYCYHCGTKMDGGSDHE